MYYLWFLGWPWTGKHRGNRRGTSLLWGGRDYPSHIGNSREVSNSICSGVWTLPSDMPAYLSWPYCRTCFFILGLISSTCQGAEILDDYHWEATATPLAIPTGICIPTDVEKFISVGLILRSNLCFTYKCLLVDALDHHHSWGDRK
jgi:hypothetical protein